MLATFSRKWPWDQPTNFRESIRQGKKGHTLRQGNRWEPGDRIHFWMGSPRNPSCNPARFSIPFTSALSWEVIDDTIAKGIYDADEMECLYPNYQVVPHHTAVPVVYATEKVEIYNSYLEGRFITVGGKLLQYREELQLARNDGFGFNATNDEIMMLWFWMYFVPKVGDSFEGQIIHWQKGNLYNPPAASVMPGIEFPYE